MATRVNARLGVIGSIRHGVDRLIASSPARFAIMVFTGLILLFTLLLSLPIASHTREWTPFVDSLFTAVSTICVTGLSTVDMATHWSGFGEVLILLGTQIGGIGVLTIASILGLVVSRRLGLRSKLLAASDTNPLRAHHGPVSESQAVRLGEIGGLLGTVAISALTIEAVIALLMFPSFLNHGYAVGDSAWLATQYSAMAFTNTGFTFNVEGVAEFGGDYWFLSLMIIGVFLGSLGFPVIYALLKNPRHPRRWSVHVKITLLATVVLLFAGSIAFLILEFDNPATYGEMGAAETVYETFFLSMMTRSGGFATVDVASLNGSSLLVGDMLMFVGGGSASTAGGIKVTTLAVLFLAAWAEAKGAEEMEAFGRRIPNDVLRVGVSVLLLSATTIAVASIAILHITKAPLDHVLFDVISAFGTCGLSTGLTMDAPDSAQLIIAGVMWMGRVGTVTLAVALAASTRRQLYRRPEERPIVG